MLEGFSTSNSTACMPGFALVISVRWPLRRPEMITRLPSLWKASAYARPMPEVPPVMKMVLPVRFMVLLGWLFSLGVGCRGVGGGYISGLDMRQARGFAENLCLDFTPGGASRPYKRRRISHRARRGELRPTQDEE